MAQAWELVRHGLVHVPCGHPSPLQHSLESVHARPCDLHGVGTLQTWLIHESPEQQPPVVHAWFSPMQVVSVMHDPLEQIVPGQHWELLLHTSPLGRHSALHWLSVQRPLQQSALVEQTPSGIGLQLHVVPLHPYEQHSL